MMFFGKALIWTVVIMIVIFAPAYLVTRFPDPLFVKVLGFVYLGICGALIFFALCSDFSDDEDDD